MNAPDRKYRKNTLKAKVKKAMEEILQGHPNGVRLTQLEILILSGRPDIKSPRKSIGAAISDITKDCPQKFRKEKIQGEGTFYYSVESTSGGEEDPLALPQPKSSHRKEYREEDFYGPFAEFLKYSDDDDERLDECTKAIPLGGNKFGKFWQTPDVIGLLETRRSNIVEFPTQVVSAEIKIDDSSQALMTAFGQACAYRLFSHKTYLVVPESADIKLLKQICHLLGIGLVCFNSKVKELDTSIFKIKLVAQRYEPDMFYVNQYLGKIAKELDKA